MKLITRLHLVQGLRMCGGKGRTHLGVAELPAAVRSLFSRGGAGRGADPAPDSGPGAERLAAGSFKPPELDESNACACPRLC
jgi:hypothetical protein